MRLAERVEMKKAPLPQPLQVRRSEVQPLRLAEQVEMKKAPPPPSVQLECRLTERVEMQPAPQLDLEVCWEGQPVQLECRR